MKKQLVFIFIVTLLSSTFQGWAQNIKIADEVLSHEWNSKWITHTEGLYSLKTSGLFLFRKNIVVQSLPKEYIVHISADNRYKLFVNGNYVGTGPAVSDIQHWFYDTYNIAPYLKPGENIIAAEVWNWGTLSPWNQISHRTAFIMQGNSKNENAVNTDGSWIVRKSEAIKFFVTPREEFNEIELGLVVKGYRGVKIDDCKLIAHDQEIEKSILSENKLESSNGWIIPKNATDEQVAEIMKIFNIEFYDVIEVKFD